MKVVIFRASRCRVRSVRRVVIVGQQKATSLLKVFRVAQNIVNLPPILNLFLFLQTRPTSLADLHVASFSLEPLRFRAVLLHELCSSHVAPIRGLLTQAHFDLPFFVFLVIVVLGLDQVLRKAILGCLDTLELDCKLLASRQRCG